VPGLRAEVAAAVRLLSPRSHGDIPQPAPLPAWPASDADYDGPPGADAWTHVGGARRLRRARADRWLAGYFGPTVEIRGDRCGGVDSGLRCGFGSHQGTTIAYAAQAGKRITPAGCRTATRLLGLAARLRLPVLTLIDTPGAAAAPADEAAGLGPAIAELFVAMASSPVPITSVVIGEGVSGGALALASPSDLWIAQDGYLAVTSPELAASILKRSVADIPQVATWLRLTPAELMSRGIVRGILRPPASVAGQAADPR
jgi:acetyl-CoA carboxylase carboxyl transferase subunit beta